MFQIRRSASVLTNSVLYMLFWVSHEPASFSFFFFCFRREHRRETPSARGGLNDSEEAAQGPERAGDYRYLLCLRRSGARHEGGSRVSTSTNQTLLLQKEAGDFRGFTAKHQD